MTPVGYSARDVPFTSGAINSDLAFQGKYAYQGTYTGFRIIDIENPADPVAGRRTTRAAPPARATSSSTATSSCARGTRRSAPAAPRPRPAAARSSARASRASTSSTSPTRRIPSWSSRQEPGQRQAGPALPADRQPGRRATGCGSHTATAVPDEARGYLYIYNGGSSGTCTGIDDHQDQDLRPGRRVDRLRARCASRQCHDNTVLINGANSYASCAGGNGISMFKFDMTIAIRPPRVASRTRRCCGRSRSRRVSIGHSAAFSYDGKTIVFGWEPGGGTSPQCQASEPMLERTLFFMDTETRRRASAHAAAPAPPDRPRELHVAQLQHRADQGRQLPRCRATTRPASSSSTSRTRRRRQVIAYADPNAAAEGHQPERQHVRSGRRRLVDLLVQRQDLRVRHLPRHDGVGPRQHRTRTGRTRSTIVEPADADRA